MPTEAVAAIDLSEFEIRRKSCKVGRFDLSPEQRMKFEAACKADHISHARIAKVLSDWGFKVTQNTVQTHRTGECGCDR